VTLSALVRPVARLPPHACTRARTRVYSRARTCATVWPDQDGGDGFKIGNTS